MKNENIISIEETETNPSPSPSAASAPLREPDPDRKSVGKVAHLPKDIRRVVNEMLDDGATYNEIVAKLTELGHPGFFYQNIQRWKNGGYQQWLRAQQQREETIITAETAVELAKDDPNTAAHLCEANEILLALKNHKLLQEINDWNAETLLGTEKSKAYFQLSRSITHQLAQRTRRERFKFDVEWKTKKHEATKQAEQQNGIVPMSKEQRAYILDKMDEILGIRLDPDDFEDDDPATLAKYYETGTAAVPGRSIQDQPAVGNEVTSPNSPVSTLHSSFETHADTHQNTRSLSPEQSGPVGNEVTRFTSTPAHTCAEPNTSAIESPSEHFNTRGYTPTSLADYPPQPIGAKWADFGTAP